MRKRRPRVLVLSDHKETAEAIRAGLSGPSDAVPELELEIALDAESLMRQLEDCRYDLLVAGREFLNGNGGLSGLPSGLPLVAVGGAPGDPPPDGFAGRVIPLPLSFTLLTDAVREALSGSGAEERPARKRRELG